jgi:hypothetical protein
MLLYARTLAREIHISMKLTHGCDVVTNPGCIIGPETVVYPLVLLRKGYDPAASIVKAGERPVVTPQRRP